MPDAITVDYASPVEETTLTGLSTLPGGTVVAATERVLTYGPDDVDCGIWVVAAGAWTRATDFDASSEVVFNQEIVPQLDDGAGGVQHGSVFYVGTTGTITPGTDPIEIVQRTYSEVQTAGRGLVRVGNDWRKATTGILAGTYDAVTVDDTGAATDGLPSETATTFIEGLRLVYLSGTSLRVEEGAAYVPGQGGVVDLSVNTDSLPTLAASTLYYVYLSENIGVAEIGVSTQRPTSTPYRGGARIKGGPDNTTPDASPDDTRRYLGSARTNASSLLYNYLYNPYTGLVTFQEDTTASPFRVVSAGTATTNTTVNLGPSGLKVVPVGCRMVFVRVAVNATAAVWLDNSSMSTSPAAASGSRAVSAVERVQHFWLPLDSSQSFRWANTLAGGSTNVDVQAYVDQR